MLSANLIGTSGRAELLGNWLQKGVRGPQSRLEDKNMGISLQYFTFINYLATLTTRDNVQRRIYVFQFVSL